ARKVISGAVAEVVEEKRIKPTIIRRRKKRVEVEEKGPEIPVEEQVAAEEAEEAAATEAEKERVPAAEAEEEATVSPIPVVEAAEPEKEAVSEATEESMVPEQAEEPEPAAVVPEEAESEAVDKKKTEEPKPKKGKKKKREQPAKIIKRPEEGPLREMIREMKETKEEEPIQKKQTAVVTPQQIAQEVAEEARKSKPSKKRKKKGMADKAEEVPTAGIRHKKKEIFERADLYEGKAPKRKDKKGGRKPKEVQRGQKQTTITVPKAIKRRIKVQEVVTVSELARAMGAKGTDLIKTLLGLGVVANINQSIDFDTAALVADEYGYELELGSFQEERLIAEEKDREEDHISRPPVVTIMGHVDHGKTS
ncbi:MAG: translation initiation factor IF-2 N-terminal domain-containing protein, partial [Deltaproteobacteria bacterium]